MTTGTCTDTRHTIDTRIGGLARQIQIDDVRKNQPPIGFHCIHHGFWGAQGGDNDWGFVLGYQFQLIGQSRA